MRLRSRWGSAASLASDVGDDGERQPLTGGSPGALTEEDDVDDEPCTPPRLELRRLGERIMANVAAVLLWTGIWNQIDSYALPLACSVDGCAACDKYGEFPCAWCVLPACTQRHPRRRVTTSRSEPAGTRSRSCSSVLLGSTGRAACTTTQRSRTCAATRAARSNAPPAAGHPCAAVTAKGESTHVVLLRLIALTAMQHATKKDLFVHATRRIHGCASSLPSRPVAGRLELFQRRQRSRIRARRRRHHVIALVAAVVVRRGRRRRRVRVGWRPGGCDDGLVC